MSTLAALDVLASIGAKGSSHIEPAGRWLEGVDDGTGGIPFVLPSALAHPRAPWMRPTQGGSHLTLALAAVLHELGSTTPWLSAGTAWAWRVVEGDPLEGYWLKFAMAFLDRVPDEERAQAALHVVGERLGTDGSVPVPGGTDGERLTALDLSPRPGLRSRRLLRGEAVDEALDRLENGQQPDGGWDFDWLAWSPGVAQEWRGIVTVRALATLAAHGGLST